MDATLLSNDDPPQITPELDAKQSLLFNCYESALEKVNFLFRIESLTRSILNRDEDRVEDQLGPEVTSLLLKLHQLSSKKPNGAEVASLNLTLPEQHQPSTHFHSQLLSSVEDPFTITEQPILGRYVQTFFEKIPSCITHVAGMETDESNVSKEIHYRDLNHMWRLYDFHHFQNQFPPDQLRSSNGSKAQASSEEWKADVKKLYGQIFRQVIHQRDHLLWTLSQPKPSVTSNSLLEFQQCAVHLRELFRLKLFAPPIYSEQLAQFRRCWTKEKEATATILKLKKEHLEKVEPWRQRMLTLDRIVETTKQEIEESRAQSMEKVKRIILAQRLSGMKDQKRMELDLSTMGTKEVKGQSELYSRSEHYLTQEYNRLAKIRNLETELLTVLRSYDEVLGAKQDQLDVLEQTLNQTGFQMLTLQKTFEDTEEKFEEMRITNRLKQLLRNMEMAENFKRNRAARIIQAAWKRYYTRKLRRLKRKARIKRKPRIPGERKRKDETVKEKSVDP